MHLPGKLHFQIATKRMTTIFDAFRAKSCDNDFLSPTRNTLEYEAFSQAAICKVKVDSDLGSCFSLFQFVSLEKVPNALIFVPFQIT